MTKKITHLALALVTLLTGCSMIPTYERPAAPVPTGFPNVTASERHSTLPSWRTYFAEPRLQQLIELALNNNRDLRIAPGRCRVHTQGAFDQQALQRDVRCACWSPLATPRCSPAPKSVRSTTRRRCPR